MKRGLQFCLFLVVVLISLWCVASVRATDYYVDFTTGDDGDSGLTPELAWKNWNKVKGETYSAGDTIKFKRGETWIVGHNNFWTITEDGTADNYITIDAYGSGTKPIFDVEIEMVGSTWTEEVGVGANVWSTPWDYSIYRTRLDGQDSYIGVPDGITYLWAYDGGADKLYIYATQNPNTEYSSIKISSQFSYVLWFEGCNYIRVQNIRIHGGSNALRSGPTGVETYLEFNNCDLWYGKNGIVFSKTPGGGGSANYVIVDSCDIDSKLNLIAKTGIEELERVTIEGIRLASECDNWTIRNCTFSDWGHNAISLQAFPSSSQGVNNIIMEHNTIDGSNSPYMRAIGIVGIEGKATNNVFRYNVERNTTVRNQIGGNNNSFIYNLVYDKVATGVSDKSEISDGVELTRSNEGNVCEGNKIYNNVFYGIYNAGIRIAGNAEAQNNLIKNNIVVDAGKTAGAGQDLYIGIVDGAGSGNIISNNCIYDEDTLDTVWYKGTSETVAEADASRTEFSDNIASDPLFVDFVNKDFHLKFNSPCINAGTDVGLTQDYAGISVPLGSGPDIGAYEYNDTTVPIISFSCSPTSVIAGGIITCSCSATDDVDSSPTVSYTVNPSTSSTGTYTTTCIALDDFGNSASSNISYTVSSAGDGEDGGITNVTKETYSWSRIIPGVVTIMKDFDEEIGIKQIQIEVHTEAQNVKIIVTKYDDKPANVSVEKSGKVYKYLQIETENLEDKLNRSVITIQVEKNWTSENNVEKENMSMFKFNESYEVWDELETVYTEENETYYYYNIELDSFSYFAIAANVVEEPEEIEEEKSKLWLWLVLVLIVVILVIIIIIIVMYKHKKKKEINFSKSDYVEKIS